MKWPILLENLNFTFLSSNSIIHNGALYSSIGVQYFSQEMEKVLILGMSVHHAAWSRMKVYCLLWQATTWVRGLLHILNLYSLSRPHGKPLWCYLKLGSNWAHLVYMGSCCLLTVIWMPARFVLLNILCFVKQTNIDSFILKLLLIDSYWHVNRSGKIQLLP